MSAAASDFPERFFDVLIAGLRRHPELGERLAELVVVGGGAIAARIKTRDVEDLDLVLLPDLFADASSPVDGFATHSRNYLGGNSSVLVFDEHTHAFDAADVPSGDAERYTMSADDLFARAEVIDGIRFQSMADVLEMKRGMGRPKDQRDVALIEAWISDQQRR